MFDPNSTPDNDDPAENDQDSVTLDVPLTELRVVIDFFRESGIFVGSVPGTIVKGTRVIGPKANVEFVAALDVSEMQNTDEITIAKVRIVGRKAGR